MKNIICYLLIIFISSCASNKPSLKNDSPVYMSTMKAPADCKYLGKIYGPHQTFTSNFNPQLGKNISQAHISQAKALGANYIEMNSSYDGGKAYLCPNPELSNLDPY
jgi:hypothetical protein